MEDHIPLRPDRSLLLGRQTSKWTLWNVAFHENNAFEKKRGIWINDEYEKEECMIEKRLHYRFI